MQVETPGGVAPAGLPHWGGRAFGCNLWRLCLENRPPLGWPRPQGPSAPHGVAAAGTASQEEDGEFFSGACGPADGPRAADDHPAPADGAQPLTGRRTSSRSHMPFKCFLLRNSALRDSRTCKIS